MQKAIADPNNLIRGVARVPGTRRQKYFCAPINKNCRVWSEK